jgi:hypothetical protein
MTGKKSPLYDLTSAANQKVVKKKKVVAAVDKGNDSLGSDDDFEKPKPRGKSTTQLNKGLDLQAPGSKDEVLAEKMLAELGDVLKKQGALGLRERKLRAELKKVQKRLSRAKQPPEFAVVDDVERADGVAAALFPAGCENLNDLGSSANVENAGTSGSVSLWRLAQQSAELDDHINTSLRTLEANAAMSASQLMKCVNTLEVDNVDVSDLSVSGLSRAVMTDPIIVCDASVQTDMSSPVHSDDGVARSDTGAADNNAHVNTSMGGIDQNESSDNCVFHYEPSPVDTVVYAEPDGKTHATRKSPNAAITTTHNDYSDLSPQEIFDLPVDCQPNFSAISEERLRVLGAHFGLKYSANLPRILGDIWIRMREQDRSTKKSTDKGTKRSKAPSKASANAGSKKNKTQHVQESSEATASTTSFSRDMDERRFVIILKEQYTDIYEKVLLFVPVDLEEVYSRMHAGGHPLGKVRLQQLLDKALAFVSAGSKDKEKGQSSSYANLGGSKFQHYNRVRASQSDA